MEKLFLAPRGLPPLRDSSQSECSLLLQQPALLLGQLFSTNISFHVNWSPKTTTSTISSPIPPTPFHHSLSALCQNPPQDLPAPGPSALPHSLNLCLELQTVKEAHMTAQSDITVKVWFPTLPSLPGSLVSLATCPFATGSCFKPSELSSNLQRHNLCPTPSRRSHHLDYRENKSHHQPATLICLPPNTPAMSPSSPQGKGPVCLHCEFRGLPPSRPPQLINDSFFPMLLSCFSSLSVFLVLCLLLCNSS